MSVHVGQCGCAVGLDMWKELAHEIMVGKTRTGCSVDRDPQTGSNTPSTFFNGSLEGSLKPRAVFVDSDPIQRDTINITTRGSRFEISSDHIVTSERDSRSVYHAGRKDDEVSGVSQIAFDKIMDQVELCDNLGGFVFQRSIGGGTGSAIGDILLSRLRDEFPKRVVLETLIYPSRESSTSALEPLNTCLSLAASRESASLSLVLDNQAAYNIARTKLNLNEPSFVHMNQFIARVVSSCTASLRFPSTVNSSLDEIVTNLVPDPVLRYGIVSMAPLAFGNPSNISAKELVSLLFHPQSFLCEVPNIRTYPQLAACVQCRGQLPLIAIQRSIQSFRTNPVARNSVAKFAPWIPNSFKVGLVSPTENCDQSSSATLLANSAAVAVPFSEQLTKFKTLFSRKTYFWHYMENGAEIDEFQSAQNSVSEIIQAYDSVTSSCQIENQQNQLERIRNLHS